MYGEESIYALIPQPVEVPGRPPMHVSKHPGNLPPTFSTFNEHGTPGAGYANVGGKQVGNANDAVLRSHATFGREGNARKPTEMLKKGTGMKPLAPPSDAPPFTYSAERKPSVPTAQECRELRKSMGPPATTKNFITSNAVEKSSMF